MTTLQLVALSMGVLGTSMLAVSGVALWLSVQARTALEDWQEDFGSEENGTPEGLDRYL